MSTALAIVFAVVLIAVPFVLIVLLWRKKPVSRLDWLVSALSTAGFAGYVLLAGRWDLLSYYARPLLALAVVVTLVVSLARAWRTPWWVRPARVRGWLGFVGSALVAVLLVGLFVQTARGVVPGAARPVDLSLPLRDGVTYVGQGGASTILNYHHPSRAQAYAVDLVGLDAAGRNAAGVAPNEPSAYTIWGRPVHSPCAGTVIEARGNLPDLRPPATDTENLAGNHVVLRCGGTASGVDVLLAHLRQGSVTVAAKASVAEGQVLGAVGNTGNTTEPHLHVHAVRTGSGTVLRGEGVPIRFDGRFLVRNDLLFGG